MHLHLLELRSSQLARLIQDVIWYRDLTDIMQQSTRLERFDLGVIATHQARDPSRVNLHAQDVFVSNFVLGINGDGQSFDRFAVRLFHDVNSFPNPFAGATVTKIDRDQNRTADHRHYESIVMQCQIE